MNWLDLIRPTSAYSTIFEDRDIHTLKGVPGEWRLYALAA